MIRDNATESGGGIHTHKPSMNVAANHISTLCGKRGLLTLWRSVLSLRSSAFACGGLLALALAFPACLQAQGVITNGGNYAGDISPAGDTDVWTFTATNGESIVLRVATLSGGSCFNTWARLYGPDSSLIVSLDGGVLVPEITHTASNSGTFTLVVGDGVSCGNTTSTGTYALYFAKIPGAFLISDDGGNLTSGGSYYGTNSLGDLDFWTFTNVIGDRFVLRIASTNEDGNYNAWPRVYDPDGVLLNPGDNGGLVIEVTNQATKTGIYTVLVSDGSRGSTFYGAGAYYLYYAKTSGGFVVSDDGGALTNGGNHSGDLPLADLDIWSFNAGSGDNINLRIAAGTSSGGNFDPAIRLYGPGGDLLSEVASTTASEISTQLVAGGAYTAIINDGGGGNALGTGSYTLCFAKSPGAYVIADDGGVLSNGVNPDSTIVAGDLDLWSFAACAGDTVVVQITELTDTNTFNPWLRLYGPDGALVQSAVGATTAAFTNLLARSGAFNLVVGDGNLTSDGLHGSGAYRLIADGIPGNFRLCTPVVSAEILNVLAIGGPANSNAVLLTATNVATPLASWSPIHTNQFDPNGLFSFTNVFNQTERERYFRLLRP